MDPQQLLETSKFYLICNKCDMKKTVGVGATPLVALRLKIAIWISDCCIQVKVKFIVQQILVEIINPIV